MKATLLFALPVLAALILNNEEPEMEIPLIECKAPKTIIEDHNKNATPSNSKVKYSNWEFQPHYMKELRKRNEGC